MTNCVRESVWDRVRFDGKGQRGTREKYSGESTRIRNLNARNISFASFMFYNYPNSLSVGDLWRMFKGYGTVFDIYMVKKRLRNGQKFGFVRLKNIADVEFLYNRLRSINFSGKQSLLFGGFSTSTPTETLANRSAIATLNFKGKSDYIREPISIDGLKKIWEKIFENDGSDTFIINPFGGMMSEFSETVIPYPHRAGVLYQFFKTADFSDQPSYATPTSLARRDWLQSFEAFLEPYVSSNPREVYFNYNDLDLGVGSDTYEEASVWGERAERWGVPMEMNNRKPEGSQGVSNEKSGADEVKNNKYIKEDDNVMMDESVGSESYEEDDEDDGLRAVDQMVVGGGLPHGNGGCVQSKNLQSGPRYPRELNVEKVDCVKFEKEASTSKKKVKANVQNGDFCLITGFRFDKVNLDPDEEDHFEFRMRVFPKIENLKVGSESYEEDDEDDGLRAVDQMVVGGGLPHGNGGCVQSENLQSGPRYPRELNVEKVDGVKLEKEASTSKKKVKANVQNVQDDVNINSMVKDEIVKDDVNVDSLVKEDIEKDDVYFPINEKDYQWVLGELHVSSGLITIYDSLGCPPNGIETCLFLLDLRDRLQFHIPLFLDNAEVSEKKNIVKDDYSISFQFTNGVPIQGGLYGDYGLRVCLFLYRLSHSIPLEVDDPISFAPAYHERLIEFFWKYKMLPE
nr:berberine bridge enzyme-like 8 [Tanacetum cinerariifolium]